MSLVDLTLEAISPAALAVVDITGGTMGLSYTLTPLE
jgi:hypothetical protein